MNLAAPLDRTALLDLSIYAKKMPAKIIRDNAFQQCTFSHVTQLSSCSWVLSHIWQNIGANICYEDSGSCFWLYDWPL